MYLKWLCDFERPTERLDLIHLALACFLGCSAISYDYSRQTL